MSAPTPAAEYWADLYAAADAEPDEVDRPPQDSELGRRYYYTEDPKRMLR